MVVAQPHRVAAGHQVLVENGFEHLFVDGECKYWVKGSATESSDAWAPIRTGMIDAGELADLEATLHWPEWAAQSGIHTETGAADAATHLFHDPASMFGCVGRCEDAPSDIRRIKSGARDVLGRLWADPDSVNVEGPGRVIVVELEPDLPLVYPTILEWPLERSPSALAISRAEAAELDYGRGVVLDREEATVMRRLRDEFRAGDYGTFHDVMPFRHDGIVYQVFFRDVVPYEGDDGLLRL